VPASHTINPVPPSTPALQERRISCEEALQHPWFDENPKPKDRALMPTFPATGADRRR